MDTSMLSIAKQSSELNDSIEHGPSREAKRFSDTQEIPCISWNLKVHYSIHKSMPKFKTSYLKIISQEKKERRNF
jgi:hypothetical protein